MEIQWILVAGLALMVTGAITVYLKREITTGQALVFAFGGAMIAIPQIANFEFSNGTVKFTTKIQAAALTTQVETLNKEQADLASTVLALTKQNQKLAEQVAKLSGDVSDAPEGNPASAPPEFVVPDWSTYQKSTENLIQQSEGRTLQLDSLKQQLKAE
ncbi:hypothetical protein FMN63_21970 [Stappia sp. BW2]|uniref:hypothetical protein n=1 Tax=Stappia sp. BW2 TaxID=2592622 RepID=UPI0011DE63A8|nr:hypothetical protein [Stappia sp. BW2]TYC65104.1 hypothetical protein FMN63_21970 [Stappia sp. BW2]